MSQVAVVRGDRRRRRRSTALLVVAIVAAVVAVASVGAAFVLRIDTSDLQSRADPVHRQLRAVEANAVDAERRLATLRARSRKSTDALVALLAAFQAQIEVSNQAVDAANQAVDQYNNGQANVADAFRTVGDAAVAAVVERTTAVDTAVTAAQSVLTELSAAGG